MKYIFSILLVESADVEPKDKVPMSTVLVATKFAPGILWFYLWAPFRDFISYHLTFPLSGKKIDNVDRIKKMMKSFLLIT